LSYIVYNKQTKTRESINHIKGMKKYNWTVVELQNMWVWLQDTPTHIGKRKSKQWSSFVDKIETYTSFGHVIPKNLTIGKTDYNVYNTLCSIENEYNN